MLLGLKDDAILSENIGSRGSSFMVITYLTQNFWVDPASIREVAEFA
jgi:hypothetical protein